MKKLLFISTFSVLFLCSSNVFAQNTDNSVTTKTDNHITGIKDPASDSLLTTQKLLQEPVTNSTVVRVVVSRSGEKITATAKNNFLEQVIKKEGGANEN